MEKYENNNKKSLSDIYAPNMEHNGNTMYKPLVAEPYADTDDSEGQAYIFNLSRFLSKCVKRVWLLVLMAVVFSLAGALYGMATYTPKYVSKSSFMVNVFKRTVVETENGKETIKMVSDLSTANATLANLEILVLSDRVVEMAIASNPDIKLDVEEIKSITKVKIVEDTTILTFTVTHSDPKTAYRVVKALVAVAPVALTEIEERGELSIIDPPVLPSVPTSSNKATSYATIGAGAAVVLFLAIIFALDFMSSTIKDARDAENSIGKRLLGVIPDNRKYRKKVSPTRETGKLITDRTAGFSYIEAFKSMRIKIENLCLRNKYKSILVTSTHEHEGKTTIAVNLAISLANKKYKVLLVECDLRRPNLFYMMQLSDLEHGILDVMDGAVPYKDAITYIPDYGVYGMLSRRSVNDATEKLGSDAMRDLILSLEASNEFDFVIYDAPPALMMTDAEILTRYVDSVVMVVKEDTAQLHDIKNTIAKLSNERAVVLGTVLNSAKKVEKKSVKRT